MTKTIKGAHEFAIENAAELDTKITDLLDEVTQLGANVAAIELPNGPEDMDEHTLENPNARHFGAAFLKLAWTVGIIRANVKHLHELHEQAYAEATEPAGAAALPSGRAPATVVTADGRPPMPLAKAADEIAMVRSHLRVLRNALEDEESSDVFNSIFELEARLAPVEEAVELASRTEGGGK